MNITPNQIAIYKDYIAGLITKDEAIFQLRGERIFNKIDEDYYNSLFAEYEG